MRKGEETHACHLYRSNEQMRCTVLGMCIPSGFKTLITSYTTHTREFVNPDKSVTIVISSNTQINEFGTFVRPHYGS